MRPWSAAASVLSSRQMRQRVTLTPTAHGTQAAVVTFGALNGTSRRRVTTTPWTASTAALTAWLAAVPAHMEGVGNVAAFEALGTALSLLETPSEHTPLVCAASAHVSDASAAAEGEVGAGSGTNAIRNATATAQPGGVRGEVLMLWLSDSGHSGPMLVQSPRKPEMPDHVRT